MKRYSFPLAALLFSAALLFIACASPTPTAPLAPAPSSTVASAPIPSLTPAPSVTPTYFQTPLLPSSSTPIPSPAASPTPLSIASSLPTPRLVVLAQNQPGPDDLVLAPDGTIYFSDVGDQTVKHLDRAGHVTVVLSKVQEPEGLVFLPDGSLIIAEQGRNRLLRYDFNTKQLTTFLPLSNRTGAMGVDGIVFDSKTRTLIVPDSPNDTLLRVSTDGQQVRTLARGLVRPTGAAIAADGSILVADENGGDIRRVPATGGPPARVARMPVPDDVVVDAAGNIYVNTLNEGAIHRIDARTGKDEIFWQGLKEPQGIMLDADGNLIVAEAGSQRIIKIVLR